jgi:hypothetical protein
VICKITNSAGCDAGMNSVAKNKLIFNIHVNSVEISYNNLSARPGKGVIAKRSDISEFSYKSRSRLRLRLEDTSMLWDYYIVLTYPKEFPLDGSLVKKHLNTFLIWLKRQGVKHYLWVNEYQKRGAAHINILIEKEIDKEKLSKAWFKIVGSKDLKHLAAGTGISRIKDNSKMIAYLSTYMGKEEQKKVPDNHVHPGRFWGCNVYALAQYKVYVTGNDFLYEKIINDFIDHYEEKLKEWSKNKKEVYSLQHKEKGFIMWGGRKFIDDYMRKLDDSWDGSQSIRSFRDKWR